MNNWLYYTCLHTHTQDGNTALLWAAMKGHLDTIKELAKAGAVHLKNEVSVYTLPVHVAGLTYSIIMIAKLKA